MMHFIIYLPMNHGGRPPAISNQQALDELSQRIAHLDPGSDSKAPLVLQQIGLLIALLPEICRLQQQIATWRSDSPVAQATH